MKKNRNFHNAIAQFIILLCLASLVGFFFSCAAQNPGIYKKIPVTTDQYSFTSFNIPSRQPPASIPLTIAVVEPSYRERVGADYSKAIKSFSNHVGSSLDEILIAKGVTTKGPYDSLDEIPYPDKKSSNLTLTQTVFIYITENKTQNNRFDNYVTPSGNYMTLEVESYEMSVEFWITFEMREPLSAEKMWIKKLDLGILKQSFEIGYNRRYVSTPSADPWAPPTGSYVKSGKPIFNTRIDAFVNILNEAYPQVLQSAWTFLNTDEMLNLDKKSKEIRDIKRY